jgi:2-polyprenyl-3-methyl-5-hydroxy-6-metoxy-1,4-benzoquinol methylase
MAKQDRRSKKSVSNVLPSYPSEVMNVYNPPMTPQAPSPMLVFDTLQAHQRTSALRAGIELKLFTAIANGARTPEALASACGTSAKGMRVLCDFLTIIGFLTKDESGYGLTQDSELFLVEGSPAYMGGMASFLFHPFMEKGLGSMTGAVRKGGTILPAEGSVSDDNPVWVEFARGMAPLTVPSAGVVAEHAAGSGPVRVLDIAAGHGMYGLTIARRNPAAEVHALDWKNVLAVAHENAVKLGVADRWHAIEGSAFATDYGSGYDAVLVTNFIHHFDVPTNIGLFEKIRAAMKPGGKMAIVEMAVNDDRVTPAGAGMFAMTMLTTTPTGDAYSQREIESMCTRAGFHDVAHHAVPATPQTVTIALS